MYQPDAAHAVTQLARAIRPGGLITFHEHDTRSVDDDGTRLPLHDQVRSWLREMLRQEGANLRMGFDLHGALSAAGLKVERVRAEANVLTPTAEYPVAAIIRAALPRLLKHGIVTETEAEVDTLDERLLAERKRNNATCLWELVFCAWARRPRNERPVRGSSHPEQGLGMQVSSQRQWLRLCLNRGQRLAMELGLKAP